MRKAIKITAVVAFLALPSIALAAAGSATSKPFAINCAQEQFKPKRIVLACGDGASWLGKLKWTSWSGSTANAAGSYNAINCTPSCASGHAQSFPVKVTLSKPRNCPGQTHPAFKRAALTYTGTRPKGAPAKLSFRCPVLPGQY
jgi:hypothetical protein